MTILQDPVRPFDPTHRLDVIEIQPSMPEPPPGPGDDVRASMRARGPKGKTTFELASRGGYLRKVTGMIAYLDEQAATYMVFADGELLRVPVRDITSRHERSPDGGTDRAAANDDEGLGTG